jgi:hypothetical protein
MTERTLAPETLTVERGYTIKDFTALRDKDFEGAKLGGAGALAGPLLGPVIFPCTEASRRHIGGKAATAAGTKRILAFQPRWVDRVTPPTV